MNAKTSSICPSIPIDFVSHLSFKERTPSCTISMNKVLLRDILFTSTFFYAWFVGSTLCKLAKVAAKIPKDANNGVSI